MTTSAEAFRALHVRGDPLVLPNPWDVGSARLLHAKGFKALATTSAGLAHSLGRSDGGVTWEERLAHCRQLVAATPLPVSADLEKGKGDSPESVHESIREAIATGLAGASIEDFTGDTDRPIYEDRLAIQRIEAAVEAKRSAPGDFVLTARCENFLYGRPHLAATIARLQAFEAAGADVLYAPGLSLLEEIREVCAALGAPVNVLIGAGGSNFTLEQYSEAGVARLSTGSFLSRAAYGALLSAADEMLDGRFGFTMAAPPTAEIEALLRRSAG